MCAIMGILVSVNTQNHLHVDIYTITNPKHYDMHPRPIDAIHGWGLSYLKGCAVKYIARAGKKEGNTEVQDLEKAIQCLRMEIERLENNK
jgi:hypothetical protein